MLVYTTQFYAANGCSSLTSSVMVSAVSLDALLRYTAVRYSGLCDSWDGLMRDSSSSPLTIFLQICW